MDALLTLSFFLFIQFICKVDGAAELQQKISLTKAEEKLAIIDCHFPSDCLYYIHWYQQKEGEPLKRILNADINDGSTTNDAGFESIKSEKKASNHFALRITNLKKEHSAMYYCACWISGSLIKRFGTGTRLIVTDTNADKVVPPILTGYLPSKKTSGKQTMLCQATKMFPDLVKFTWQKKSNTVDWTDVPEDNVVEQRNGNARLVTVTSMMILDQKPAKDDLYKCTAIHEGGTNKYIELKKDNKDSAKKPPKAIPNTTCPPNTEETLTGQISDTPEQMRRLYVFVYAYGVMLMKNGVYFCVISIFLLKRKFGKKEESS